VPRQCTAGITGKTPQTTTLFLAVPRDLVGLGSIQPRNTNPPLVYSTCLLVNGNAAVLQGLPKQPATASAAYPRHKFVIVISLIFKEVTSFSAVAYGLYVCLSENSFYGLCFYGFVYGFSSFDAVSSSLWFFLVLTPSHAFLSHAFLSLVN
jgi:hypothetical protein